MTATEAATQVAGESSISERLVAALADTWRAIQARHAGVPDVALVLGSGTTGRRRTTKLGHFASRRWVRTRPAGTGESVDDGHQAAGDEFVHELLVGAEGLVEGAVPVLCTLLHEAAHGLAEVRGIADTSGKGVYHNLKFRRLAEELGLVVTDVGGRGWSHTTVPETTAALYAPQVEALTSAITAHRVPESTRRPGSPPAGRMLAAVCGCPTPRRFRIARATMELGGITCDRCHQPFTLTG
jgi:hypothetical protein